MPWGISPNASNKEKIKADMGDFLHGLNSAGKIDYITYSELFDFSHDLLDKMYELGKSEKGGKSPVTHDKDKFVGITIYGFCDGFFGRDSYEDKKIIASGGDWVVAKGTDDITVFATFNNADDMEVLIAEWSKEDK